MPSYRRGAQVTYSMNRLRSAVRLKASPQTKKLLGRGWNLIEARHRARLMKAVKEVQERGGDISIALKGYTPEQKLIILYELSRQRPLTEDEMKEYRACYRQVAGEKAYQALFGGKRI